MLLNDVQWFQELHERYYWHDIFVLNKVDKVNKLLSIIKSEHLENADTKWPDICTCILSSMNAMNVDISKTFNLISNPKNSEIIIEHFENIPQNRFINRTGVLDGEFTIILNKLSAHLQDCTNIAKLNDPLDVAKCYLDMLCICVQAMHNSQLNEDSDKSRVTDPLGVYFYRLMDIKKSHIFHERHHIHLLNSDTVYYEICKLYGANELSRAKEAALERMSSPNVRWPGW